MKTLRTRLHTGILILTVLLSGLGLTLSTTTPAAAHTRSDCYSNPIWPNGISFGCRGGGSTAKLVCKDGGAYKTIYRTVAYNSVTGSQPFYCGFLWQRVGWDVYPYHP